MLDIFIPLIILLVAILIGRFLNEKSYKLLDPEKKSQLIDLFSKYRIYGWIFLIILISILFLFPYFKILNFYHTMILYISLFFIYFIGTSYLYYRILKKNNYKKEFINIYILSIIIRFLGIAIFFIIFSMNKLL